MIGRQLTAFNTALESENRIHSDEVAQRFGFAGGLVPGVDVYAYLTWGPVERWGLDWVEHGVAEVRFPRPTYDGDLVSVTIGDDGTIEVASSSGVVTGTGRAASRHADTVPAIPQWAARPAYADRPVASPESLIVGATLGSFDTVFDADDAHAYLDSVREVHAVYADRRLAHPGWISRLGNEILMANVRLGPWMHVGHRIAHFGLIHHRAHISCRGIVAAQYERKGHRFSELDLVVTADDRVVATIHHTAIYEPRQVRDIA